MDSFKLANSYHDRHLQPPEYPDTETWLVCACCGFEINENKHIWKRASSFFYKRYDESVVIEPGICPSCGEKEMYEEERLPNGEVWE